MRRLAQLSFLLMFCCGYSAQLLAAPPGAANQTAGSLPSNDPGYIAEDPVLAKLVGKPAPALTLKSIDGKSINLSDLYGKRPVYLKLWATYCIPCRVQMPGLRKIFASHGNEMAVIAVNAGVFDDIDKVREFARDFDLKMPVAIDDGRLGAWIGMKATPVHLVMGRDGRVIFAGHQDGRELDAA
ncbi:MAG TPA: TlpA disulfide reductase family protein, partial [Rhizomicrobium sp.]